MERSWAIIAVLSAIPLWRARLPKIILQRQLADLGPQRLQIDGGLFWLVFLPENAGSAFEQLALPRCDLIWVNVELPRASSSRVLSPFTERQSHFALKEGEWFL
jgi:hypothetical protein